MRETRAHVVPLPNRHCIKVLELILLDLQMSFFETYLDPVYVQVLTMFV